MEKSFLPIGTFSWSFVYLLFPFTKFKHQIVVDEAFANNLVETPNPKNKPSKNEIVLDFNGHYLNVFCWEFGGCRVFGNVAFVLGDLNSL